MIIPNGTIEPKQKTGGGIDPATGYPVAPSAGWGEPIACQYVPNSVNLQGRVSGGHFTIASYRVYIEERPFSAEQVRLRDTDGNVVGEFSLLQVEPLVAVGEICLLI